jgi:CheY-like chemotaxis protein
MTTDLAIRPRILVITDDEQARGVLAAVLRADGHTVDVAADRSQAVGLIEAREYVLMLSDLRMPGLDGPELSRVLEARRPGAPTALIFVARPAFMPDLARFLIDVAAPVLVWPTKPAEISRVVARTLAAAAALTAR